MSHRSNIYISASLFPHLPQHREPIIFRSRRRIIAIFSHIAPAEANIQFGESSRAFLFQEAGLKEKELCLGCLSRYYSNHLDGSCNCFFGARHKDRGNKCWHKYRVQGLLMASISEDTSEETPLQVRLNGVATFIGFVGLTIAVLVLVVLMTKYFTGHSKNSEEVFHSFLARLSSVLP